MKKFLLLAGVALATLSANKAVATTDYYASINAKAEISVATEATCWDLNFGKIVIAPNEKGAKLKLNPDGTTEITNSGSGGIAGVIGATAARCSFDMTTGTPQFPDSLELSNGYGKTLTVSNFDHGILQQYSMVGATLTIDNTSEVTSGTYTGTFTFTHTY